MHKRYDTYICKNICPIKINNILQIVIVTVANDDNLNDLSFLLHDSYSCSICSIGLY